MTTLSISPVLDALIQKGVSVPMPASVWVAEDVNPDRISEHVELFPGARLSGSRLSIGPGCKIGSENPATVINSQLESNVTLKGGYVSGSVFLNGSSVGNAGHIREGCLFEEEASTAHAVGGKQTILMSFVTLGSLINFCDCLMTGGTSRKNHSEVGSSFIHFNYTPHQDKATPSLFGDVPRGVLLDQPPIFLGGQGGVVGPVVTEFGVIQAAGSISRRDLDAPHHLYQSAVPEERWMPYQTGTIREPLEKLVKNLRYIGSLSALRMWYHSFRSRVMTQSVYTRMVLEGAEDLLASAQAERIKQLKKWLGMVSVSTGPFAGTRGWVEDLEEKTQSQPVSADLETLADGIGICDPYPNAVVALSDDSRSAVITILESEIQRFVALADPIPEETNS